MKAFRSGDSPSPSPAAPGGRSAGRGFFNLLASVRLAGVLIILIAIACALATLVPQNRPAQFYADRFPGFPAGLIALTAFHDFFRSGIFFAMTGLFALNLAACAVRRVIALTRSRGPRRHGPDVIHGGVLLLIIAGTITLAAREEVLFYMKEGDARLLPDGSRLSLTSFEFLRYPDGRPREWTSRLRAEKDGAAVDHEVEVNRPLALGGVTLYQHAFRPIERAVLFSGERRIELAAGDGIETPEGIFIFSGIDPEGGGAFFIRQGSGGPDGRRAVARGQNLGPFRLEDATTEYETGLLAVRDPASWLVIAALMVASAGLVLTVARKVKEAR